MSIELQQMSLDKNAFEEPTRTLPAYQAAKNQHDENFHIKHVISKKDPGELLYQLNLFM